MWFSVLDVLDECGFMFFLFVEDDLVVLRFGEKLNFIVSLGCVEYGGKVKKGFFCKIGCNNLFRRKFDFYLSKIFVKKFIEMDGNIGFYEGF